MDYIVDKEIFIDRLIMVSPSLTSNRPEVASFYGAMTEDMSEVKKYVKEIIVLHSNDDPVHALNQPKELAEIV